MSYQSDDSYQSINVAVADDRTVTSGGRTLRRVTNKKKLIILFLVVLCLCAICVIVIMSGSNTEEEPVVEDTLQYYSLEGFESSAVCNDGSPAGLYFRPSTSGDSSTWVILMQGGAYCFDEPSCDDRLNTLPEKTTSIGIAQTETGYGILSSDINSNPQYYDANHIDIAYCSSDLWTGNNTAENNDVEIRGETWNWLGAHILHTALAYTVAELGMDTATEIVLAGRTSGGVGNLVNLPTTGPMVEAMVPAAKVYGLIDSGWVVDMEPYANQSCVNVDECSVTTGVQLANEMWQPEISAACLEQYTYESGEFYKCYQALYAFEFITIPTMVIENQADPVQLTNLACANPTTDEEIEFAIEVAAKVVEEVISGAAVENFWMPSCMVHGTLDQAYWNDIYMPDSDSDEAHLIDVPAGIELFDGGSGGIALYDICPEDDPFMCGNCP